MKKLTMLALVAAMLVSATACGKSADLTETEYLYGQIESISGNDVTLRVAEYHETEETSEDAQNEADSAAETRSGKRPDFNGERPEKGDLPDDFDPEQFKSGEKPEGFDSANLPDDFDPEQFKNGEKPEEFDPGKFGGKPSESGSSKYTLTNEETEIRIPVGTTVTTALGVETSFEVLTTGDIIKYSVAQNKDGAETVTAVWIMEE